MKIIFLLKLILKELKLVIFGIIRYFDISSIYSLKNQNYYQIMGFLRLLIGGAFIKYLPTNNWLNKKLVHKYMKRIFG